MNTSSIEIDIIILFLNSQAADVNELPNSNFPNEHFSLINT